MEKTEEEHKEAPPKVNFQLTKELQDKIDENQEQISKKSLNSSFGEMSSEVSFDMDHDVEIIEIQLGF